MHVLPHTSLKNRRRPQIRRKNRSRPQIRSGYQILDHYGSFYPFFARFLQNGQAGHAQRNGPFLSHELLWMRMSLSIRSRMVAHGSGTQAVKVQHAGTTTYKIGAWTAILLGLPPRSKLLHDLVSYVCVTTDLSPFTFECPVET